MVKILRRKFLNRARRDPAGLDGVDNDCPVVSDEDVQQGQPGETTFDDVGLAVQFMPELTNCQNPRGIIRQQFIPKTQDENRHCSIALKFLDEAPLMVEDADQ